MSSVSHLHTAARPVRVLTVDDQPLFRDAARALIGATPSFEAIAEVASGEDALAVAPDLRPDLVLVDVTLPGIDGLETSRRLSGAHPDVVVVLISAHDDPLLSAAAGSYGAVAFVSKERLRPRTLQAIWERHGPITPAG